MNEEIRQYSPLDNDKKATELSSFICISRGFIHKLAECVVIY